jgi:hypothetical protein
MKKEFALEAGGPKRLGVTYPGNLANAEVLFDGQRIITFATKAEFLRGTTCKLPDGSILSVRYGPMEGMPLLKGVHVIRNGAAVSGSAADAVPKWAWVFMIACGLIPVVTLGGGVPALLGFGGVGGVLSVSRLKRWSTGLRAGVCALIAVACWGALGVLVTTVVGVKAVNQGAQAITKAKVAATATDKSIHEIGKTYYNHRYKQKDIDAIEDRLYDECDRMQPAQCADYLQQALREAQSSPDLP